MRWRILRDGVRLLCVTLAVGGGCARRSDVAPAPPPDARRPVIKSEAELAAERRARIETGAVVPTTAPTLDIERPPRPPAPPPAPPLTPGPGAIAAELLTVNDQTLTVAEILYPLETDLAEIRRTQTLVGFRERARQLIRQESTRVIGALLVYAEGLASLAEGQRQALKAAVDREVEDVRNREFGGSGARLEAHLAERGLTLEQFRTRMERELVARQYLREKLLPQVQVRRDELLTAYRERRAEFTTSETRELLMIEVPFARLLPEGGSWERASAPARAQAKAAAVRRIREAEEALATRPFEDVAREFSFGPTAAKGGSFGAIGKPLQPPYDELSRLIFDFEAGQVSAPIETPTGWYIVKCGTVQPAVSRTFAEVQDDLRRDLMERRFVRLSTDYYMKLAQNATISSLDAFLNAAVREAERRTAGAAAAR